MGRFLEASDQENECVKTVLFFALLCILESISFTRKDGQYLRWDYRSGRRQGKKVFDKGVIPAFDKAIKDKLHEIVTDLRGIETPEDLFANTLSKADVVLRSGSCLELLPELQADSYDCVITSPPYCNRYDYKLIHPGLEKRKQPIRLHAHLRARTRSAWSGRSGTHQTAPGDA